MWALGQFVPLYSVGSRGRWCVRGPLLEHRMHACRNASIFGGTAAQTRMLVSPSSIPALE